MRPRTLKSAAEAGDLEAVQYHLAKGADVNGTTAAGHHALGGAIINGHADVVEFLIENGANIEIMSTFGWSPLYIAAWAGRPECVAQLLVARAQTETRTIGGWHSPRSYKPLHIAAERGHLEIVMLLVADGARVDEPAGSSETALELAENNGHKAVVKFLKKARKEQSRAVAPAQRPRKRS